MANVNQLIKTFDKITTELDGIDLSSIPPPLAESETYTVQKRALNCNICLEMFTHPVMLPCQHSYCFSCIAKSCG